MTRLLDSQSYSGGFIDGNGCLVVAGDRVEYRFENHRRGVLNEALQDGDASVTWDDDSHATVKWCNLAKLPKELETMKGYYKHYKGGVYEIIGTARHTETEEDLVVYRAVDVDSGMWVRPIETFFERMEDGQLRFEKQNHG